MNLKETFLLLLICVSSVALSNTFDKESLQTKSMEELKALLKEVNEKDSSTPELKNLHQERDQLEMLQRERLNLDLSCIFSSIPVINYVIGSCGDCEKAEKVREEILEQRIRIRDAHKKFHEAHPEWALVMQCIMRKEYEE